MYHNFLIHSFTDGHLGCLQHSAIINGTTMNIEVHKCFWTGDSRFLRYNPSSGITRTWVYCWALYSVSLIYVSVLMPVQNRFDYSGLEYSLISSIVIPPTFDPAISLLGLYPKNPETPIQKNLCTPMFTAALLINKVMKDKYHMISPISDLT